MEWEIKIKNYLNDFNILPTNNQIDFLIKLNIIIIIVSLIFDLNPYLNLILIFIIIILCYIKGNMIKENFTYIGDNDINIPTANYIGKSPYRYPQQGSNFIQGDNNMQRSPQINPPVYKQAKITQDGSIIEDVNTNPFAYDAVNLEVDNPYYTSNNYKLVGSANPKTFIPPVIAPPIADLSYWKSNNLVTHSRVNASTNVDVFQSGYVVSNFCGDNKCPKKSNIDFLKRNNNYQKIEQKQDEKNIFYNDKYNSKYNEHQKSTHLKFPYYDSKTDQIKENFTIEDFEPREDKIVNVDLVNKSCGFYPDQPRNNNLPVNYTVGSCAKSKSLNDFNKNLFTQAIQPGVYAVNQVNEPINSNMGISFDQQFEPLTYKFNGENDLTYTQHDPLDPNFNPEDNILKYNDDTVIEPITQSNVYDPRFSGYGTSYRAYTDKNVGQPRFYYDDVNSVRMPNYVIRSKIDFTDFGDTYGPMDNTKGNENNSNIRALANQKFLDDALEFRTGMQERLMRKINSEAWQQRSKPITKNSQRMLSGGGGRF